MANPGDRDANGSQFYILYKSALHLDGKHTVFGRVAGGLATLDAIEKVPTDAKDRPLTPVVIEGVEVFVDPFARKAGEESEDEDEEEETEVEKEAKRARAAADEAEKEEEGRKRARWFSGPAPVAEARSGGVGRYLGSAAAAGGAAAAAAAAAVPQQQQARAAPPPAAKKKFGNFDAW
jgi:peptidyl-prolyl cis-trans isomerase-like 2